MGKAFVMDKVGGHFWTVVKAQPVEKEEKGWSK